MRTVYFDSTILSYLYDERPEIEFLVRATKEWWQTEKPHFDCFLSNETLRELGDGEYPRKEQIMQEALKFKSLPIDANIIETARYYMNNYLMPKEEGGDALHLALASHHKIDYLLSWNYSHLVNDNKRRHIHALNSKLKLTTPVIISPLELRFAEGDR